MNNEKNEEKSLLEMMDEERTRGDLNPRAFSCTGFPVQRRTTRLQVQNKEKKIITLIITIDLI